MSAARVSALTAPAAALLLAGCGSAPPVQTLELDAELPGAWTAPETSPETSAEPSEEAVPEPWWHTFGDGRLLDVVDEALVGNQNLARAAARLDAASAEAAIAGADVFPRVDARGTGARQQQVLTFLKDPQTGASLTSRSTSFGVSLDVSWELDLWGRLRSGRSAAAADLQASIADYEAARLSLAGQAAKAWFAAVEAKRQVDLAESTAASFRRTAETVRKRYETGVRPSIDLRLALADQAGAEAALAARRAVLDRAVRQLEILLGRYPAHALDVSGDLAPPPADVPAGLPADLLARRPDLVAAERRLAAADRRLAASRRALFPRLSLTASGGRASDQLADLLDGDFSVWAIAGSLLQPIFQGGRLRAQVRASHAARDAAVAGWANDVLAACAEVETLIASEGYLREQERAQAAAAAQARAAHDLATSRYESGLDDVTTLLQAQRGAAEAESRLFDVRRRRLEARVDLHLALGGDFSMRSGDEGDAS